MQSRLRLVRTILGARDSICPNMHRQLSASIWTLLFLSVAIKAWSSGNSRLFRGSPFRIKPIGKLSPKILWAVGDKPKAPPHPEGSWNLLGGRVRIIKPFWWAQPRSILLIFRSGLGKCWFSPNFVGHLGCGSNFSQDAQGPGHHVGLKPHASLRRITQNDLRVHTSGQRL